MAITLKDVAERAGVSRSAVSRTFTEGASVSSKTRQKVEKAAKELNYSPNFLARSLTTRRTKMIGLVSDNFRNPIFLEVFDLFTRGLQDRDLRPLLVNLSEETEPAHSIKMLRQYSVDGVVLASSTLAPTFVHDFRAAGLPVVHAFGRSTATPEVPVVGIDNRACGRLAAKALLDRGYKHIAFMGGPEGSSSTQGRHTGFLEVVQNQHGIRYSSSFANQYSFEAGRAEMLRLLQDNPAEAYFCGDDVTAIGALSAIRSAGLRCPDDIGLIGLNDMEMAAWDDVNLTTIHQPVQQIVKSSIELIEAILEEPDRAPESRLFGCSLVERGTLRPLLKK